MSDRGPRTRLHKVLTRTNLTVLGTAAVLVVGGAIASRTVDLAEVLSILREADPALLGAALLAYLLSWPLRGRRYGDVLVAMDRRFGTRFLTWTIFASQTANLVVPARAGDGVRAYLLNDRGDVPYPIGIASLAVERVFDLVALTTLGGVAFAFLYFDTLSVTSSGSAAGVTIAVGVGTAVLVLSVLTVAVARTDRAFGPRIRASVEGRFLSKAADVAIRFGASIRVVAERPRALGRIYAGSVAVWALDILTAVLVLAGLLGADSELVGGSLVAVGALAVSVGNLAKVLPLSQGGIGLYEAAFTSLVVAIAPVSVEAAVTAAILDHALKNAVTLAGGAVAAIALNASPTRLPEDASAPNPKPPNF